MTSNLRRIDLKNIASSLTRFAENLRVSTLWSRPLDRSIRSALHEFSAPPQLARCLPPRRRQAA
jgi:hypothetical protein